MMNLRGSRACAVALSLSLLASAAASGAEDIDPRAQRILRDMGEYLASAEEFAFSVSITFDRVFSNGQKIEYARHVKAAVRRPDGVAADITGDLGAERLWYDGKRFVLLDVADLAYSATEVPGTIDAAFDYMAVEYGITSPVADFIYSDPYATLSAKITGARYLGRHDVEGVRAYHLAFEQEEIDWQLWVEDGPRPVPRKLVISYKSAPSSPQFRAVLSDWDFAPRLHESAFRFEPPEGAVQIDFPVAR